jgi:Zn-dependent protease with chaperone function
MAGMAMKHPRAVGIAGAAFLVLMAGAAVATAAPTVVKPGFNIFTVEQDVEIGRQSALAVEQQLPMLNDAATQRYVAALGARLAAQAPGAKFPYRFKVVNLSDLNAFALPGGYIYVHRGLIDQVRTEGELAGVMAHEIAHVALRHPTNQASKAYLAQAGLGVLGGMLGGKSSSSTGQIVGAIGGFGMNTLFLKFSRSLETQADISGAQIMARAGYDPIEMAHFFAYMAQQAGGNQGSVASFLNSHPAPANRDARIQQEASLMGSPRTTAQIGSLAAVQTQLRRLSPARTSAQLAAGQAATGTGTAGSVAGNGISIERPSTSFRIYQPRDRSFQIELPVNWSASGPASGLAATFAPRGGLAAGPNGRQQVAYGVILSHYVPFDGVVGTSLVDPAGSRFGNGSFEQAASDLVAQIQEANTHLAFVPGSEQRGTVSGRPTLSVRLVGRSPASGRSEQVTVATRELQDGHVIYVLMIAPEADYAALAPTFDRMTRTLRVNEGVAHHR